MGCARVSTERFLDELEQRRQVVDAFLAKPQYQEWFAPQHLHDAAFSYVTRRAKRLRPAVLLFACGAAGGHEQHALPAAAAVELAHTWTLVHDDLIDNDEKRRGGEAVHVEAARRARQEFGYAAGAAAEYGRNISILAGDVQHAWSVAMFLECAANPAIDTGLVVGLLSHFESRTIPQLIAGETLDVQLSGQPLESVTEEQVLSMLRLKTGVLLEFCGAAGAALGCGRPIGQSTLVDAIATFAGECGIAFQLQDDILGIVGDETKLGKPVGSDLREGKRTTVLLHAWRSCSDTERRLLERVLGNTAATDADVEATRNVLVERGGIAYTQQLAEAHVAKANEALGAVPDSDYKALLQAWARFMTNREF